MWHDESQTAKIRSRSAKSARPLWTYCCAFRGCWSASCTWGSVALWVWEDTVSRRSSLFRDFVKGATVWASSQHYRLLSQLWVTQRLWEWDLFWRSTWLCCAHTLEISFLWPPASPSTVIVTLPRWHVSLREISQVEIPCYYIKFTTFKW